MRCAPATIDESVTKGEVPRHMVRRLARAKAEAAKKLIRGDKDYEKAFVLAADTVVAVGRRVVGKAELEHEAGDALRMLRGRAHRVHTAICLLTPDDRWRERVVETRIRFRNLTNEEIGNYLASGEWKRRPAVMPSRAASPARRGEAGGVLYQWSRAAAHRSGEPAPGRRLPREPAVAVKGRGRDQLSARSRARGFRPRQKHRGRRKAGAEEDHDLPHLRQAT